MRRQLVGLALLPQDPKQPCTAGCGVCILIMIGLLANEGAEAFYLVNR